MPTPRRSRGPAEIPMGKREVTISDGRRLIFYTFGEDCMSAPPAAPGVEARPGSRKATGARRGPTGKPGRGAGRSARRRKEADHV